LRVADEVVWGVFGGQNGLWMLAELDRGSCGNMPAAGLVDVHVRIYQLYRQGRRDDAERLHARLPLLVLGSQHGVAFAKELLWRRGVIRTKMVRDPQAPPLDQHDLADLERCWNAVATEQPAGDRGSRES
jgi:4-hydroxy-tetrahydrodipicolinate synthase